MLMYVLINTFCYVRFFHLLCYNVVRNIAREVVLEVAQVDVKKITISFILDVVICESKF